MRIDSPTFPSRPAWIEIDLGRLHRNLQIIPRGFARQGREIREIRNGRILLDTAARFLEHSWHERCDSRFFRLVALGQTGSSPSPIYIHDKRRWRQHHHHRIHRAGGVLTIPSNISGLLVNNIGEEAFATIAGLDGVTIQTV